VIAAGTHGPSALWYATRGAGATTLVLLTASVALGIGEVRSWQPLGLPRFALATLHRTLSLLAVVLLAVHVATTALDAFPRIGVLNAVVPFVTSYRPLWIGLGTVACDLVIALVVTSLVRRRLGYGAWRALHWLAYACWPVAVLHGLGAGSDTKASWMLVLTLVCTAAVVVAIAGRLAAPGTPAAMRTGGAAVVCVSGLALAVWLPQGPLAQGWARRAGTPSSVLAAFAPASPPRTLRRAAAPVDPLGRPFTATLAGRLRNGVSASGVAVVDLTMHLRHGPRGVLRVRLGGQALPDGGLHMDRSAVMLGPPGDPGRYRGRLELLEGTRLRALVGSADGHAERLTVDLSLGDPAVTGQVVGTPVRRTGGAG
jgi:methionine sulfoxide reductase heme-binding subunit